MAQHLAVGGDGGGIGGAAFLSQLDFEFAEFGDVRGEEAEVGGGANVVVFGGLGAVGGTEGGEGLRGGLDIGWKWCAGGEGILIGLDGGSCELAGDDGG